MPLFLKKKKYIVNYIQDDMSAAKFCSQKSKYKNDPKYECDPATGRYKLKKGFKSQAKAGAPKRPLSAYFLWSQEHRPTFVSQNKGVKVTEIAKLMGAAWKGLSEQEKAPYQDKAKQAKKQYGQKAEQFKSTQGSLKEVIEKPKVKKAPSGFILWSKEERPKIKAEPGNEKMTFGEIAKALGARWKLLSEGEKAPWQDAAKKLKVTFG